MKTIDQKYHDLGGSGGFLGQPEGPEQLCPDGKGKYRHFEGGSIYWHPQKGAFEVHGSIRHKWASLGWERSLLGYPVTDETATPDGTGRFNHFEHGSIYWHPVTGAFEVHGSIRHKWASLGWERSLLGYPVTDETATPDGRGRFNHFEHGSIFWHPSTGAFEVHGGIRAKWASLQWDRGYLGYPISDELRAGGSARFSRFQGGVIYWTPQHGAQDMRVERPTPTYLFSLDNFRITRTRAWNDDTDYVNFALKVGNAEEMQRNLFVGDVDDGEHEVNLYFGPIRITDPNTNLVYSFQILNSGHGDYEVVKQAMGRVAKELSTALAATGNIWGKIAAGALPHVVDFVVGIFTANCDGPVAVDKVAVTGQILGDWTHGGGMLSRTQFYPGTDSATGCGANSEYYVTWSVIRL